LGDVTGAVAGVYAVALVVSDQTLTAALLLEVTSDVDAARTESDLAESSFAVPLCMWFVIWSAQEQIEMGENDHVQINCRDGLDVLRRARAVQRSDVVSREVCGDLSS
jgi:hypothetical protein